MMKVLYYFITRKVIYNFSRLVNTVYKSLFYMFVVGIIIGLTFALSYESSFKPGINLVFSCIIIVSYAIGFLFRLISQGIDYDSTDEPQWLRTFFKDCTSRTSKSLQEYEEKIKEEKEKKRQLKEAKRKEKELIKHRSEILDL